ncbi:DUF1853 family protein [Sanyastnella coralliicola]|uniref:DUF1853 family protein n=1 Tax=Sanyastnella coralliicola TaxID=3069118 RepID=UPI0027BAF625|nr:DUF1853 family protein [Longitalea sp. SCSIO 12813]
MKANAFLHQSVANLAWCLGSQPLMLSHPNSVYKTLDEAWFKLEFDRHLDWLYALDADPERLEAYLTSEKRIPLGKKFERYISFWLKESPYFIPLAENVQLIGQKNTIGEIDFVFRESETERTYHLEVACKFYLSASNNGNWEQWIGPNGNDTLRLKMDKLDKQLNVTELPEAKAWLDEQRIPKPEKALLMKGMFFHHFQSIRKAKAPHYAAKNHHTGWWLREEEMARFFGGEGSWAVLPKSDWLSNYHINLGEDEILDGFEVQQKIKALLETYRRSVMVVRLFPGGMGWEEGSRGFVVPNHWPNH